MTVSEVPVGGIRVGGGRPLALIAGSCVIENRDSALRHAGYLRDLTGRLGIPFVYKSSYDKANRTSLESFRGPGLDEGLRILEEVKREIGVPVLTDVHEPDQIAPVCGVVDVAQIPAFLCRQTDFVTAVARAARVVNVKKGQFLAPWDVRNVAAKVVAAGNANVLLTERGVSFGYNNLVSDMRSLVIMRETGFPVVFDATHSLQLPGGLGEASGGDRQFIAPLARAGAAVGVDGLFMEVHEDPDRALSDGPTSFPLAALDGLLRTVKDIDDRVKGREGG
jgi:2-dehydro-3-deoxyphosphooctonate aldolase (KDO 8-P synthase)